MTREEIVKRLLALDFVGEHIECRTCGRTKNPRGRDSSPGRYGCDRDCPGHDEDPRPTSLHPGERASDFGYVSLGWDGSTSLWELIRDVRAAEENDE